MCRLAAFPPNFPRDKALEILKDFEGANTDGVGSVYVKNGKFIVDKHPIALSELLDKKHKFLNHMPYNGWTLAHLRNASHGENTNENTHPFIIKDFAFIHNGVWSSYNIAKAILENNKVKFNGETDSEVAGHFLQLVGHQRFLDEVEYGGVFMALNRNGSLRVVKTSGDLKVYHGKKKNKGILLASDFPSDKYKRSYEAEEGWYFYNKFGKCVKYKLRKTEIDDCEDIKIDDNEVSEPIRRFQPSYGYYGYNYKPNTVSIPTFGSKGVVIQPTLKPMFNKYFTKHLEDCYD